MKNFVIIVSFAFLLSGCTPAYNFTVPDIVPSKHKINADLKALTVSYGEGPVYIQIENLSKEEISQEFVPAWYIALVQAIAEAELFDESAEKKVKMIVEILELDIPFIGITFPTQVITSYKLIDDSNNTSIYSNVITTEGSVPYNYSFFGYKRGTESLNRAVRKNISTFISHIQTHKSL